MKSVHNLVFAALMAAALIGMVTVNFQCVSAPRSCAGCVEFKKLTHEFEKNAINAVGNPEEGPQPHLRELVETYALDTTQIFLGGGPDTLPGLLEQYQQAVLAVFSQPPDPDKQQLHDQINEFKQLTKDFEGAVAAAIIAATQDN